MKELFISEITLIFGSIYDIILYLGRHHCNLCQFRHDLSIVCIPPDANQVVFKTSKNHLELASFGAEDKVIFIVAYAPFYFHFKIQIKNSNCKPQLMTHVTSTTLKV